MHRFLRPFRLSSFTFGKLFQILVLFLVAIISAAYIGRHLAVEKVTGFCLQKFNEQLEQQQSVAAGTPFIFIGGVPRSGASLLASVLSLHPNVTCTDEGYVVSRTVRKVTEMTNLKFAKQFLAQAGMQQNVLDAAVSSFLLGVIKIKRKSSKICTSDPFSLRYAKELARMFPVSKSVLMIRDGYSVAQSIIRMNTAEAKLKNPSKWANLAADTVGLNMLSPQEALNMWDWVTKDMLQQCCELGAKRCYILSFERLIWKPKEQLLELLEFLELPENDAVLQRIESIAYEIASKSVVAREKHLSRDRCILS